jgi:hypothetical protein
MSSILTRLSFPHPIATIGVSVLAEKWVFGESLSQLIKLMSHCGEILFVKKNSPSHCV